MILFDPPRPARLTAADQVLDAGAGDVVLVHGLTVENTGRWIEAYVLVEADHRFAARPAFDIILIDPPEKRT